MIDTTTLRSIHHQPATAEPRAARSAPLQYRQVPRSPVEEFQARVLKHGRPLKFPQSVIGLILQKQSRAEVAAGGITIKYQKVTYRYWHEDSLTIANNRGQKALVTFDPDNMDFIHVLTDDGRYIESIPQKNKVSWFDDEALRAEMKKKMRAQNRDIARYQEIHKETSEQKVARALSNSEKIQAVNTLPHPASRSDKDPAPASFPKADRITRAGRVITKQHEASATRIARTSDRLSRISNEEESPLWDRRSIPDPADQEYAETAAAMDELDELDELY